MRLVRAIVLGALLSAPTTTPARIVTDVIGPLGDGIGHQLFGISDIAFDPAGNLYVMGYGNAFRIAPGGTISQIIDATGDGAGHALGCTGGCPMAVDADGNFYTADGGDGDVFKVTPANAVTRIMDATGDGAGHALQRPGSIATDGAGNVYVAGYDSNNVFRVTSGGAISQVIDSTGDGAGHPLSHPNRLLVTAADDVIVRASGSNNVFRITSGGSVTQLIDPAGDGLGNSLDAPLDVAVDGGGAVYVAGGQTDNAFKISAGGAISEIIDAAGDGQGHTLAYANSIAVAPDGTVYVAGFTSRNVFRVPTAGAITQVIDSSGDGCGQAFAGGQLAVDGAGYLYASSANSILRRPPSGRPLEIAWFDNARYRLSPTGTFYGFGYDQVFRVETRCPAAPVAGCRASTAPSRSKLILRGCFVVLPFMWKWSAGEATTPAELGDPTTTDDYDLCMYDDTAGDLIYEATARAGADCGGRPCWRAKGSGFVYRNNERGFDDNVVEVLVRPGETGRAKALVKGLEGVMMPGLLPLALPITVQLQSSAGTCWESHFGSAGERHNDMEVFRGRGS